MRPKERMGMAKVALAYSGKLDTTICVHWLRDVKGMKVYTFSANLGQFENLEPLAERAVELGASAAHIADLRETFVKNFIFPCIRANAEYESGYFLFSALSRPLISRELIKVAQEEGCDYVAHGSRCIGNDIVRFENCLKAIAPDISIITPLRELSLNSPQDDLKYAEEHGIGVDSVKQTMYNAEQNIWGSNIQARNLRDPWEEIPDAAYLITTSPVEAPSKVTVIEIKFNEGLPVAVDGEDLSPVKLVDLLNRIGGRNAIGRYDVIENRLADVKTRELYEAPAATILYTAHKALESVTLEKDLIHFKEPISRKYAELIYEGKWFSPFRESLDAFFAGFQKRVSGKVRLKLYKGQAYVSGVKSEEFNVKI